jgi:hypothetical protein
MPLKSARCNVSYGLKIFDHDSDLGARRSVVICSNYSSCGVGRIHGLHIIRENLRLGEYNFLMAKGRKIVNREQVFLFKYTGEQYQQSREWSLLVTGCHT